MHGVSVHVLRSINDFILIFICNNGVSCWQSSNEKIKLFLHVLTIIGGGVFVGSQAWEWENFIKGEYGAIETKGGSSTQFVDKDGKLFLAELLLHYQEVREQDKRQRKMVYGRRCCHLTL
jgi:cytochrome c oxidase subunit 3